MSTEHILLTISVLTSRKEDQIRRCLDSLAPLRREIPSELIVVDTSEDAHMHEVLTEYTDRIIPFHWIQDFSAARNVGLEAARGEWFLYLDDDEWFVELDEIIDFFKSGNYKNYNGATYIQRNFSNMSGTFWDDDWVSRMARIRPGMRFKSPIHEFFDPAPDNSIGLRSIVNHFGYVFINEEEKIAHFERNHVLLQKMIEEEPHNVRWRMQMMLEYSSIDRNQELLELGEECLHLFADSRDPEVINAVSSFYAAKMMAYHEMQQHDKAYEVCIQALEDSRVSRLGRAYFHTYKGEYALEKELYSESEKEELEYLELYEYFKDHEAEQIMLGAVPFIMQTYSDMYLRRAYSLLICAGLKQKNPAYLKRYYSKLRFDVRPAYLLPVLPEFVVEAMATMHSEKLFVKILRDLGKYEDVWQKFEIALLDYVMDGREGVDRLTYLLEKAEIQAGFVKLYPLRRRLSEEPDGTTDEELIQLLEEYAKIGSEYYDNLYTDEDRKNNFTKLPEDYRAALILTEVFAEEDLRKRIPKLKEVVAAYPPFAEAMKRYMTYLGEQIRGDANSVSVNSEMEQVAQQIMGNVRTLLDSGMVAEAYGIVKQLREMLPEDQQVKELEQEIKIKLGS